MRKLFLFVFLATFLASFAQDPIKIVHNSLFFTADSTYVQYVGLKKGDVVTLRLKTDGKKELEEVVVTEYRTQSEVLKEYKPKLRYKKEFKIYNTGVYLITLVNAKGKKKVEVELKRNP